MDQLTNRPPRKHPIELQLTAMIDVFSMIVIFLILGTVFGASEMVVPPGMNLPRSASKEGVESAPRISIHKDKVFSNLFPGELDLETFRLSDDDPRMMALRKKLKGYLEAHEAKTKNAMLNALADETTPYKDVFDVVRVFRLAGAKSILFVATGEPAATLIKGDGP